MQDVHRQSQSCPAVPPSKTAFGDGTAPFGAGMIQSTLGSPRLIQMALHLTF